MGALEGKVAVVTGASSGSGLGIAQRFVEEGATVVLLARGGERLEKTGATTSGAGAVPIVTDVGGSAQRPSPSPRSASASAGSTSSSTTPPSTGPCRVELLSDLDIQQQIATNFRARCYTCRAAIPLLRAAGGGDIVNTSSESTLHPFPMLSMYVATKAAFEAFALVLAQEVRDDDIRVTTVIQGGTNGAGGGSTDWEWDPEHGADGDRPVDRGRA